MYKYYKSDFPLLLHTAIERQTSTGELVPVHTDTPFNIRFYVHEKGTAETGYLASYDGEKVHNCTILSPTDIMVYIDQSQMQLPTGDLYVEIEFLYPDTHYEGDDENNIKRLYTTGVTLTADPNLHDEGAVTVELFNEVIAKEIIALAEQKAIETAATTAQATATTVAQQVAEQVTESYIFATDSDIDSLWP